MTDATNPPPYDPNDGRIYPTHSCFDDAMEFFPAMFPDLNLDPSRYRIVHALCGWPDPADPRPYAHAWVEETHAPDFTQLECERGVYVWQGGIRFGERIYYAVPLVKHYEMRKILLTTHYTLPEAAAMNAKHVSYGPWAPQYIAACANGDAKRRGAYDTGVNTGPVRIVSPAPKPRLPLTAYATRNRKGSK